MPNSSLPFSASLETTEPPEPAALPPAGPDHPPSAPDLPTSPRGIRKEVSAVFHRLFTSFARSEAIHQARLDECWNGPHWHLMAHSTWSVK